MDDYNHDDHDCTKACGFTEEETDQIRKAGGEVLTGKGSRSMLIERVDTFDNLTTRQKIFLAFSLGESIGEAKAPSVAINSASIAEMLELVK